MQMCKKLCIVWSVQRFVIYKYNSYQIKAEEDPDEIFDKVKEIINAFPPLEWEILCKVGKMGI